MYSFGQNKYGKLGVYYHNAKDGETKKVPVKISVYKRNTRKQSENALEKDKWEPIVKDKNDVVDVCAGFNHSLALTRSEKAYSWGYSGKGVLGRNTADLPVLSGIPLQIGNGIVSFHQTTKFLVSL
jgi:alpha-tubulin suppressor-like RCC1 family protein